MAEDLTELVGFGMCEGDPATAMIRALHVLPSRHREGTGSRLLEALLNAMKKWGDPQPTLNVLVYNRNARRFYEAHDWSDTGHRFQHAVGGQPLMVARYEHLGG